MTPSHRGVAQKVGNLYVLCHELAGRTEFELRKDKK